jgi:hypothetical protein
MRATILLVFVLVTLTLGMLFASPFVSAQTLYFYPTSASRGGPDVHSYGTAFYDVYKFSAHKSGDGVSYTDSFFHSPVLGYGDSYVNTYIFFYYKAYTPGTSDYYTFNFEWYLDGRAELLNSLAPLANAVETRVGVFLTASLYDETRNILNYCKVTTVLSASLDLSAWTESWDYNNAYFPLSCTIALLAGDTYDPQTYVQTYDEAAGAGGSIGFAVADVNLTVSQPDVTISGYSVPSPGCVLSGTAVMLPGGGTQLVDKLKHGDEVLGYNVTTGTLVPETIIANSHTKVHQIMSINDGLLNLTSTDQPLYVRNGTWQGWVKDPENLTVGEAVLMPWSGTWLNITSIQTLPYGSYTVYDLQVTGPTTFIANGLLALDKGKRGT